MSRRWLHPAQAMIAVALLTLTLVGGGAAAQAAGHRPAVPGPPPVLAVHVRPEGFTIPGPNFRPGGPVTFRVTAEGAYGYWWNVYKLLNGATIEQFVEWLGQRSSPDLAVSLPAMKALYTNVEWAGGAKVYPDKPLELTQTLTPGTYYFGSLAIPGPQNPPEGSARTAAAGTVEPSARAALRARTVAAGRAADRTVRAATEPEPGEPGSTVPSVFGWLDVTEEYRPARLPRVNGVVYMDEAAGRDIMLAPRRLPAKGRVLVRNNSSQPQEAVFMDLRPGATDRDIRAYFEAQNEGRPLPPVPFYDSIGGMLALSPDKQLIMGYELPPNRYGIFSWLRDADTGVDSVATGMHRVVTLR